MSRIWRFCPALLMTGLLLAGCGSDQIEPEGDDLEPTAGQTEAVPTDSISGVVTDLTQFEQFIATSPEPEQFRARYPDVLLVLPGEPATMEMRSDNSRYFAELDQDNRIVGGRFQ